MGPESELVSSLLLSISDLTREKKEEEQKRQLSTRNAQLISLVAATQAHGTGSTGRFRSGIRCFREARPIERVGFYIPGGSAPLPSTVLMLGVPSHIAENPVRVLCSPPQANGEIDPIVLATATLCGIDQVYRVGAECVSYFDTVLKKV